MATLTAYGEMRGRIGGIRFGAGQPSLQFQARQRQRARELGLLPPELTPIEEAAQEEQRAQAAEQMQVRAEERQLAQGQAEREEERAYEREKAERAHEQKMELERQRQRGRRVAGKPTALPTEPARVKRERFTWEEGAPAPLPTRPRPSPTRRLEQLEVEGRPALLEAPTPAMTRVRAAAEKTARQREAFRVVRPDISEEEAAALAGIGRAPGVPPLPEAEPEFRPAGIGVVNEVRSALEEMPGFEEALGQAAPSDRLQALEEAASAQPLLREALLDMADTLGLSEEEFGKALLRAMYLPPPKE